MDGGGWCGEMRVLILAFLLAGCANVRPQAALCDVPQILPMQPVPAPVPWHITNGCWYIGIKANA